MHRHSCFHGSHPFGGYFDPEDSASDEASFGGRGGSRFRGGHPFRHFGPFGFGFGGPFGFRSGRKLSSADLQLLVLSLLREKPRHGYDLIKAVEERSRGFYSPSPGVIYPALTYLEEAGLAAPEAEGAKKLFHLTDAGKAYLEERRAEADALLEQLDEMGRGMDRVREAFASGEGEGGDNWPREGRSAELAAAFRLLRSALREKRRSPHEELLRVAEILRRAAEEIRRGSGGTI